MSISYGPGLMFWAPPGAPAEGPGWQLMGVTSCGTCGDSGWEVTYPLDLGGGHLATLMVPCRFVRSAHHQRQQAPAEFWAARYRAGESVIPAPPADRMAGRAEDK